MSQVHNKLSVNFNIPGKTFLLGEYVAVAGGPSLVASTGPYFVVQIQSGHGVHPFHQESPAGRWIIQHQDFFSLFDISFQDPYQTGGFGASTAQFIAVCAFQKKYQDIVNQKPFNFKNPHITLDIWRSYRELFSDQKTPPSGADLIAQLVGGLTSFCVRQETFEKFDWPFATQNPTFYKTAYKVNTHEHLATLNLSSSMIQELEECVTSALAALKAENFEAYKKACLAFSNIQEQHQLLTPDVQNDIKSLKLKNTDFARGCGALGADVIAIYSDHQVSPQNHKKIASLAQDMAYGTWMEVQ